MLLLNAERTSMWLGCLLTLCHAKSIFYSSNPAHSCYISMKQASLSTAVYMAWLYKRCLPAVQLHGSIQLTKALLLYPTACHFLVAVIALRVAGKVGSIATVLSITDSKKGPIIGSPSNMDSMHPASQVCSRHGSLLA